MRLPRNLEIAIRLAQENEDMKGKFHHGAVISRGGRILAVGHNRSRNDPAISLRNASLHAECDVLSRCRDSGGATLWVGRVNPKGAPRLSRPCSDCVTACRNAGIKKVMFTIDETSYGVQDIRG